MVPFSDGGAPPQWEQLMTRPVKLASAFLGRFAGADGYLGLRWKLRRLPAAVVRDSPMLR